MATATRKCRHCKERNRTEDMIVTPNNAAFCNDRCASEYGKKRIPQVRKKEAKRQKREFYDKDIPTRRKAAVLWFNRFIRLRDRERGCISCGKNLRAGGKYDAGHYITAGSCTALRFDESNVHGQCVYCNQWLSGALRDYRPSLIERIGEAEVERLEGPQPTIKITAEWYKSIEDKYKALCRELEKEVA